MPKRSPNSTEPKRIGRPPTGEPQREQTSIRIDPLLLAYAKSTGNVSRCIEEALRAMIQKPVRHKKEALLREGSSSSGLA